MTDERKTIAILGGGPAGLAAAWELTRHEGWQQEYDVAVYQLGWRLGGKCRTGRGQHDRIEEHGVHIFQGWYANAFAMMRATYEEFVGEGLQGDHPYDSFDAAVKPLNSTTLAEYLPSRGWLPWTQAFPKRPGTPGEGDIQDARAAVRAVVADTLKGAAAALVQAGFGRALVGLAGGGFQAAMAADLNDARVADGQDPGATATVLLGEVDAAVGEALDGLFAQEDGGRTAAAPCAPSTWTRGSRRSLTGAAGPPGAPWPTRSGAHCCSSTWSARSPWGCSRTA